MLSVPETLVTSIPKAQTAWDILKTGQGAFLIFQKDLFYFHYVNTLIY